MTPGYRYIYVRSTFNPAALAFLFVREDLPSRVAAGVPVCLSRLGSGSLSSLSSTVDVTFRPH